MAKQRTDKEESKLVDSISRQGEFSVEVKPTTSAADPVFIDDLLRRLEISDENVTGISFVNKFSKNNEVDVSNKEDVWTGGGTYSYLTTAQKLDVESDNANDTAAGTGARTILISGLDQFYSEINEEITLNGVSVVQTSNAFLRVHRVVVKTAGSSEVNEGTICLKASAQLQAHIEPESGASFMSHYTIPAGKTGYLIQGEGQITASSDAVGEKSGSLVIFSRLKDGAFTAFYDAGLNSLAGPFIVPQRIIPDPIPEKTDIKGVFEAFRNNTKIVFNYSIILKDN